MAFNVRWIYVVSFLDLFAVSLTIPMLSAHIRQLGASHMLVGFMSSAYAGAQLISGPVVGSWSDRKGRQVTLLISLLICSICYVVLGLVESLFLVFALRLILGIFKHVQVLTRTIVADRVSTEDQSSVSGRLSALGAASFMIGPAIGGNLAELENGFTYVCFITAFFFSLNTAISYLYLPDLEKNATSNGVASTSSPDSMTVWDEMKRAVLHLTRVDWSLYWDVFTLKFLMAIPLAMFSTNYFIKIQETFNITPKWAGYTISFQGLVGAVASFLAGWLDRTFYTDDTSFKRRNLHGFVIMAISYTGLVVAPSLTTFMFWTIPLRASSALLRIVEMDMMLARCPESQRGSLVGTSNSISNVARLVAPLLAGIAEDLYGTSSTDLISLGISMIGIMLSLKLRTHSPRLAKID